MKKYNSIQNIRDKIDEIDLKIIDLISKRKDLVDEVVKLKKRDQIVDQERINFILNKLNDEAKKRGVPEKLVEKIWNIMINTFIEYEKKIYDSVHKK